MKVAKSVDSSEKPDEHMGVCEWICILIILAYVFFMAVVAAVHVASFIQEIGSEVAYAMDAPNRLSRAEELLCDGVEGEHGEYGYVLAAEELNGKLYTLTGGVDRTYYIFRDTTLLEVLHESGTESEKEFVERKREEMLDGYYSGQCWPRDGEVLHTFEAPFGYGGIEAPVEESAFVDPETGEEVNLSSELTEDEIKALVNWDPSSIEDI